MSATILHKGEKVTELIYGSGPDYPSKSFLDYQVFIKGKKTETRIRVVPKFSPPDAPRGFVLFVLKMPPVSHPLTDEAIGREQQSFFQETVSLQMLRTFRGVKGITIVPLGLEGHEKPLRRRDVTIQGW